MPASNSDFYSRRERSRQTPQPQQHQGQNQNQIQNQNQTQHDQHQNQHQLAWDPSQAFGSRYEHEDTYRYSGYATDISGSGEEHGPAATYRYETNLRPLSINSDTTNTYVEYSSEERPELVYPNVEQQPRQKERKHRKHRERSDKVRSENHKVRKESHKDRKDRKERSHDRKERSHKDRSQRRERREKRQDFHKEEEKPQAGLGLDLETGQEPLHNEKRFFSFLYGKSVPPVPLEEERQPYPWLKAPLLSQIVFFWLWPILKKGYKRTLVPQDLWYLPDELTVETMHATYRGHLERILRKDRAKAWRKAAAKGTSPDDFHYEWPMSAVPRALFLTFKWQYSLSCIFLALSFTCQACAPLIIRELIEYVQYSYFGVYDNYNIGIGYTVGAVVLIFINGVLINHFFHNAMVAGAATKSILTKDVLLKCFKLSSKSKHKFSTGRVASLMSTDLSRIDLAIGFQPLVLCFPIPVVIAVALLLTNMGWTSLTGIGLFVVSLFICVGVTTWLFTLRETSIKYTDERISLVREVLNNLKIIKFYAWEFAYKKNITNVRNREMKFLFNMDVVRNCITAYAVTLPTLSSMLSFVTMWATDNMKSPSRVFSSLSLFSILAQAIMLLPIALSTGADATIGFRRCKDFLGAEEYDDALEKRLAGSIENHHSGDSVSGFEFARNDELSEKYYQSNAVEIKHANFMWEQFYAADSDENSLWADVDKKLSNDKPLGKSEEQSVEEVVPHEAEQAQSHVFRGLFDVNLTIARGEFVVITGLIGSGKSSLLNAIAGFMKLANPQSATFTVDEDLRLCGAPWIQNATLRDNVLFGQPMDRAKYNAVISACCLEEDIKQLTHGDRTEIGEKGVTLSGGQKARINLARAVYNNAGTLLFDDVLSAVDSRVGKHIITHLFGDLLQNHTRVLATHQLSLVSDADKIVFLNGDGSIDVGTLQELLARNEGFKKLYEYSDEASRKEIEDDPEINYSNEDIQNADLCLLPGIRVSKPYMETEEPYLSKQHSALPDDVAEQFGKTIEDEDVAVKAISWDVYKKYISIGSGVFGFMATPIFLFLVALSTFSQLFTNTWLSFWMERRFPQLSDHFYITFYVIFAVLTVFFTSIQFTMLAYMSNKAAKILNVKAVEKMLHVPMSFMDTNPLGRVLNRFSKDTDSLDNQLGEQLKLFIFPLATIIGIIILCICYLPWFAIAVPFLALAFWFFGSLYSASSREIKRLESVQRSVVYNNFNEILNGMATIKAYNVEGMFVDKNDYLLNRMNEAYFLSIANQRWLCVHLDAIAAIFALIVSMLCVTRQFNISASSTGLLLNYTLQIVGLLSLTVRAMTQVENEMNSVERLYSYAFDLPQEAPYQKSEFRPPKHWPISGYIQFNDVSLRYRPNLPLVLKDLNFGVYPGEKLGICGRTGAGKSSIMTGLYRLSELESGSITIDGLDIGQMGLRDLRSKLSIIPQDPVLFKGSIRKNLDPFHQFEDDVLWDSLRRSGLIDASVLSHVRNTRLVGGDYESLHKYHLDQIVQDEGTNFSLGEKQLIALARSLVRDSKILILDEATSSVDYETDSKIQKTIATEFNRSTVLCIAHRLRTILDYDRILVMDKGQVVEKGTPWNLYRQKGIFRSMCDKVQITADDFRKPGA